MVDRGPIVVSFPLPDVDADDDAPMTEAELEASRKLLRDLDLSSCDFVGDMGCTDPDCWRCFSPLCPDNLRRLAKNLATAGQLMRAWQIFVDEPSWYPGCNLKKKDTSRLVRVTHPRRYEGVIVCLDHVSQLGDADLRHDEFSSHVIAFYGHRCLMCGVDAVPGRHCENAACARPLHPQWPAVYCSNDCALGDQ